MRGPYHVGICGSYGGLNLGDEAILEVILRELRRRLPVEVTVFSREPKDSLQRHDIARAVALEPLSRAALKEELHRMNLLILGGGGILFDEEASTFVGPALAAHELGVPVMTWAIGAGPLESCSAQAQVRAALSHARVLTVRDEQSRKLLHDIGVMRPIRVTADPAFMLDPEPFTDAMLRREGIDPTSRLIGISVRGAGPAAPDLSDTHDLLAELADYLVERLDADVVFVPMEHDDVEEALRIASRVQHRARFHLLERPYSARQVLGLMQHFTLAVGMRLHFLIFAAVAGLPFVGLPYGKKISALIDEFGVPMPPIQCIASTTLLAAVDRAWDERASLRQRIAKHVEPLRERACATAELAAGLLQRVRAERRTA